jgi:glycosyltransferase involved in cell wall biosynthesis
MRIVHVATGFLGGPEVIVRQLIEMQRAAGHHVTLIYGKTHNGFEAGIKQLPSDLDMIGWDADRAISFAKDRAAYRALVQYLRALKPDIVHMHNSKAGALGRLACRRLGLRNIYSPHGPPYLRRDISSLKRFIYFSLEWMLCLIGDQLVASSAGEMQAIRFLPGAKHLIYNGVNIAEIERKASGVPVKPPDGKLRIIISSRVWAQKNPELVARIAAQSPPEWEWCWIGDGPLRDLLTATGRVEVLGWQEPEAVLATVKTADIYLQASHWEGMSFALLEAMTLGKPCVVSNVPGNQDLVQNAISGFVCDNDQDYLDALSSLAADVTLRQCLGKGAAQRIAGSFSLDKIAVLWSRLYRGIDPSETGFRDFVAVSGT